MNNPKENFYRVPSNKQNWLKSKNGSVQGRNRSKCVIAASARRDAIRTSFWGNLFIIFNVGWCAVRIVGLRCYFAYRSLIRNEIQNNFVGYKTLIRCTVVMKLYARILIMYDEIMYYYNTKYSQARAKMSKNFAERLNRYIYTEYKKRFNRKEKWPIKHDSFRRN